MLTKILQYGLTLINAPAGREYPAKAESLSWK
jgi:hypothetical protein